MKRRRSSIAVNSLFRNSSSSPSAESVVAATAGEDSWKTWAGRSHGSSNFEWMDLIRGSKREFNKSLNTFLGKNGLPPPGTTCPVCFCEADEWHITRSCSHAVCMDCLRGYTTSQVQDPLQSGPLRCPVCPQVLRRKDALIALKGDPELIRQWDEKIRNKLLRALPSYRPCPNCSSSKDKSSGGGFVTPSCLAPHYQERRDEASKLLDQSLPFAAGVMLLVYVLLVSRISHSPSSSPIVDLFFMLAPIGTMIQNFRLVRRNLAEKSRQVLFRPISVGCPCCNDTFLLPASSTKSDIADAESKQWMERHTRPCPSCSVPINKHGGCNHMQCPSCNASFCWACMQLRTACRAYQCNNGARFGNAVVGRESTVANASMEDSLLNRIDSILSPATRPDRQTSPGIRSTMQKYSPYWENALLVLGLFGRNFKCLQAIVESIMHLIAIIASTTSWWMVSGLVLWNVWQWLGRECQRRERAREHWEHARTMAGEYPRREDNNNDHHDHPPTASEFLLGADERNQRDRERNHRRTLLRRRNHQRTNMSFRNEDDILREALRRSVVDR